MKMYEINILFWSRIIILIYKDIQYVYIILNNILFLIQI